MREWVRTRTDTATRGDGQKVCPVYLRPAFGCGEPLTGYAQNRRIDSIDVMVVH